MRNLKKVLSLTLALVMMLGMMTFAGAAEVTKVTSKDMTDMDKVVNKEAVSLLVDLGIINGIKAADGTYTFNPVGNIERGAYAKMVYAVMMGSDNADVYKGVNTGLKDVKGHWAEGFIGYCVSTKIAAGNGNGTFTPNANITVVAGAKMLLVGLGYDAKLSGYENDPLWSINIMRDAQAAGLLEGIGQASGDTMTRDTAAQMIYNALFAKTVTPKFAYDMGVKYLDEYREGEILGLGNYKLAMKTGVLTSNEQYAGASAMGGKSHIGGETYAVGSSMLDLGKTVSFAVQLKSTARTAGDLDMSVGNIAKIYSTNVTATSDNKVVVLDAGMDATDAQKWLTNNNLTLDTATAGKIIKLTGTNVPADAAGTGAASSPAVAGHFVLADLNMNNNTKAYAIDNNGDKKIDYLVTSTKSFTKVTDDPTMKTNADGKATVKVPGIVASYTLASNVVGHEGLKKNDQVLVLRSADGWVIEKAESFVGQLTATKGDKAIIGGKTYAMSNGVLLDDVKAAGYNKDVTYWLDECGNIIQATAVTATVDATYAYGITKVEEAGSAISGYTYRVKLLLSDGTVEIAPITKIGGETIVHENKATGEVDFAADALKDKFVTYEIDKKGNYEVTLVAGGDVKQGVTTVTPGKAAFSNDATIIGNANTSFYVIDGSTVKTTVGIANAPKFTGEGITNEGVDQVLLVDGIAKMVCLVGEPTATTNTKTYVYVTSTDYTAFPKTDTAKAYNEYSAIVDGVATTVKTAKDFTFAAKGFYDVTIADGLVSSATYNKTVLGVKFMDGVVRVGTTGAYNYYTYDTDSLVYVIDDGAVTKIDVKDISTDTDDQVLFVKKNDTDTTTIGTLFIVKGVYAPLTGATLSVTDCTMTDGKNNLLTQVCALTAVAKNDKAKVAATAAAGLTVKVSINGAAATANNQELTFGDTIPTKLTVVVTVSGTEDTSKIVYDAASYVFTIGVTAG